MAADDVSVVVVVVVEPFDVEVVLVVVVFVSVVCGVWDVTSGAVTAVCALLPRMLVVRASRSAVVFAKFAVFIEVPLHQSS